MGTERNGFDYQTRLGITSHRIAKIYEEWSKELSKHKYIGVKVGKCDKIANRTEWKSSRKENICVNSNENDIMSKKNYRPGEYSAKQHSEDSKKLPPFRTGKYIPKDDVYSCGTFIQNERSTALSSKSRESTDKAVSGLHSPLPFRTGKYTPNDSNIYVKGPEKLSTKCPSPTQGSPKRRGRKQSIEQIIDKLDGICLNGRKSPSSPRSRTRIKSSSNEGIKSSSLEQIGSGGSTSKNPAKLTLVRQISHSAETVNKNSKARPKSAALENYVNCRSRTRSENALSMKATQRPRSSILENSTPNLKSIVRDIDIGSPEKYKPNWKSQIRPRSAVLDNSSRLPMRIVTSTKGQTSAVKSSTLDRTSSQDSGRYLRKGSDSSVRGHQRSKTATSISSSRSERICNTVKTRKARRELHRNAAYVKPRRNRNYKPVEKKQGSSAKKKTQAPKREKFASDQVDNCIHEKTSAVEKPFVLSLFVDKFCMCSKLWNGQFRIPTIKRSRVMTWKIKRISYLLYEKVLIVYHFVICVLFLVDLIYSHS